MYTYTFPQPLDRTDFTYFHVGRKPGRFGVNGDGSINLTTNNQCVKYLMTPEMERFMKYNKQINRVITEPELIYKFTFRGIKVFMYPGFVICDSPKSDHNFKFFRGRTQYYKVSFLDRPAFDVQNLNDVIDATLWTLAQLAPWTRKGRAEDLVGLSYPAPLAAFFQPYRDTAGETWDA